MRREYEHLKQLGGVALRPLHAPKAGDELEK
jgi:hypothetical protein